MMRRIQAILVWSLALGSAYGQTASIELGPDQIGINEAWSITVTVRNGSLDSYLGIPEIRGFRKGGTSTQSETSLINGQLSSSNSITVSYLPTEQGTFVVQPFTVKINGKDVYSPGKRVKVGPPVQVPQARDPFRDFFSSDPTGGFSRREPEFVDIQEDAFFSLQTDRSSVYVGEGLTMTMSFWVADDNRAPMRFLDLGRQLSQILKKVKPTTCWEENFNIEEVKGESVQIGGKPYTQYKIYQAKFYPLNTQPINFPSVGLEMIKFKVAKNPSFFGQGHQEDRKTFYSKPKTVYVNELPPHPLRESVAVGDYHLSEELNPAHSQTGKSVSYQFRVYGEGNISAIEAPKLAQNPNFDFYNPNVQERITRVNGHVAGAKLFSYYLIPKEPGKYPLSDYFRWVFFNPTKGQYDTLRSEKILTVVGESQKNQRINNASESAFYERIREADNALQTHHQGLLQMVINIVAGAGLFFLSGFMVVRLLRKRKHDNQKQ